MKIRNIISIGLAVVSISSCILASAIPDSYDSLKYETPFYVVAMITGLIAIILHYWISIRRVTYPAIICMWAWLYEHQLSKSEFSRHTYRVYVFFGRSYKNLYTKVRSAFDRYIEDTVEV